MSEGCRIKFRSIRLGSLRTYPLKHNKHDTLLFTETRLSFNAVLCKGAKTADILNMHIPSSGITLIEGDLAKFCPHIWITTDSATAEQIRMTTSMHQDPIHPTPYFDPESKHLADRRICVIPFDDPMKENERNSFIKVVDAIAKDRSVQQNDIFKILESNDSRLQLIECTEYILNLKDWRNKLFCKPATHSRLVLPDENDTSSCDSAGIKASSHMKKSHRYALRSSSAFTEKADHLRSLNETSIGTNAQHSEIDSPVTKPKTDDREVSPDLCNSENDSSDYELL